MPPKASLRQRNATPARSTRANVAPPQDTPSARRSTRATSRAPAAAKDVISNPALPEVQTQQSYAYGSSKTPALPEQLHARDTMSMRAVANRLNDAAVEAERNFEAHAAEVRRGTPESQEAARNARSQMHVSKEALPRPSPRPLPSETPDEVRKETRTAAWVHSSQLDDIVEEDSKQHSEIREPQTPARNRETSVPSSFPSGSFNHSYNYERGEREPNLPRPAPDLEPDPAVRQLQTAPREQASQQPQGQHMPIHRKAASRIRYGGNVTGRYLADFAKANWRWICRMTQTVQKSIFELPDSPAVSVLVKGVFVAIALSLCGMVFCTLFTWTCDASSPSIITHHLQSLCGQCSNVSPGGFPLINISGANTSDTRSLLAALQQTQSQIKHIEQRLNSRIDSSQASHSADTAALRLQQDAIELQIRRLSQQQSSAGLSSNSASEVPSPLIPKINFFSPSNGAVVLPFLTSPTRAQSNLFSRLAFRMLRLQKTLSAPPITALEPWLDEGDCWCAAEQADDSDDQDSARLGIQTSQPIYPTELVIEHFPSSGSLEPGTAPKEIELWADFSELSFDEWEKLHINDLIGESPKQIFTRNEAGKGAQTWARIGTAVYAAGTSESSIGQSYEMSADGYLSPNRPGNKRQDHSKAAPHVQRFNLQINQNGLLHYSNRFLLRVKNNHGAAYTCLYRVRLHGLPLDSEGRE